MRLRAQVEAAALTAGLDVRYDPNDAGVLRLWADNPVDRLRHQQKRPTGRCVLCDAAPARIHDHETAVPEQFCPARPAERLVGLIVIRDEVIVYAEVDGRRWGGLARETQPSPAIVAAVRGFTS